MTSSDKTNVRKWWFERRFTYNMGLIISGIISFLLYAFLGEMLIAPYDYTFEITLFTIFFQMIGYLIMVIIANIFYSLGYFIDIYFNKNNSEKFRRKLYNLGFLLSVSMPFFIPVMIVITYFFNYF